MNTLIKTEKLGKTYGLSGVGDPAPLSGAVGTLSVPALTDVNITIASGEMVAIMGPSGCGKSTLMHLLGLLDTPSTGRIYFKNRNISKFSESERAIFRSREVGFVFQQFNLLPRLTTLENVLLPTLYYRRNDGRAIPASSSVIPVKTGIYTNGSHYIDSGSIRRLTDGMTDNRMSEITRAKELLKEVGLEKRYDHKPNQLSGGEQQRVAIARSLINDPSLILADEPTGNLDSRSGSEIMALLNELNKKGKTLAVVTHDPHVSDQCQRTIRMKDGRVVGD